MSSLYSISIPVLINILTSAKDLLQKGAKHAQEKGVPFEEYLSARIIDDMFPLRVQIFVLSSTSRKAIERLTGVAPPTHADGLAHDAERNLDQCLALLDETLEILRGVRPETMDGGEKKRVPCAFGPESYEADLVDYVHGYPIPTAYFHLNMAYAILRGKGVPVGKKDYISPFMKTFDAVKA